MRLPSRGRLDDYLLPEYNGIEALRCARQQCPQIPFLLVSGTIGEQAAIESLKSGATDYVLKILPERLVPAIRRAAEEAKERAQLRKVETELIRREKYFRTLTENALDVLCMHTMRLHNLYATIDARMNDDAAGERLVGVVRDFEILSQTVDDRVPFPLR